MNTSRSYDFSDLIVNTKKKADGPTLNQTPHYLNISITQNDIFTSGLTLFNEMLVNPYPNVLTHIAIGTDDTTPNIGQTGLIAETGRWPIDIFNAFVPGNGNVPIQQLFQSYFPLSQRFGQVDTSNWLIKEIGLFGNKGNNLFTRQLLTYDNRSIFAGGITNPVPLMIGFLLSFTVNFNINVFITGSGDYILNPEGPWGWGQPVIMTAVPDPGHSFDHWNINSVNFYINPITVLMMSDINVNLYFT